MVELKKNEIMSIDALNCNVRYVFNDGKLLLCIDDVFSCVFGDSKYSHIAAVKDTGDAEAVESGNEFFDIFRINKRLFDYNLTKNRYDKNPEKYKGYVDFLSGGGLNVIVQAIEQKTGQGAAIGELVVKNIDYLGVVDKQTVDAQELELALEEIEEKEAAIANLKVKIDRLENEVSQSVKTKQERDKALEEIKALTASNIELEEKIQRRDKMLELSKSSISEQEEALEDANSKIEEHIDSIKELTQKVAEKEVTLREATEKAATLEKSIIELEATHAVQVENAVKIAIEKANEKHEKQIQELRQQYEQKQQTRDRLRELLTGKRIWLRLAIFVIAIFLPFTFMAVWKYIAIPTPNIMATLAVGALCLAIAFVWDAAILVFAVNGKRKMAAFGSFFQFVFFSAKFDYLAKLFAIFGDGLYWQEFIVVTCAVIYSPLLVWQVTELATKDKTNN